MRDLTESKEGRQGRDQGRVAKFGLGGIQTSDGSDNQRYLSTYQLPTWSQPTTPGKL